MITSTHEHNREKLQYWEYRGPMPLRRTTARLSGKRASNRISQLGLHALRKIKKMTTFFVATAFKIAIWTDFIFNELWWSTRVRPIRFVSGVSKERLRKSLKRKEEVGQGVSPTLSERWWRGRVVWKSYLQKTMPQLKSYFVPSVMREHGSK